MTDVATAPTRREVNPIESLRKSFTLMEAELAKVLPRDIPPERFVRVVMTSVQKNPKLLDANRQSLYQAAMFAAQDGLLPDGAECALVPRKGVVEYTKMYRGLLKLLWQSGHIGSVQTEIVYANDKIRISLGDDTRIDHEPVLAGERGAALGAYAIIRLKNGFTHREWASIADIQKAQRMSGAADGKGTPAWNNWADQMARKFVLKRAAKLLPLSAEDRERIADREDEIIEAVPEPVDQETPATPSRKRAEPKKDTPPPAIAAPVEHPVDALFVDVSESQEPAFVGDDDGPF